MMSIGYLLLKDSAGMLHLKKLSNAGLTHVHLLPTFQFAGVDDEKENWKCIGNNFELRNIIKKMISWTSRYYYKYKW